MRSVVALMIGMIALASAAGAQTPASAPASDRGYAEGFAQSAFGNVTSQAFGGEIGVTVVPNVQVFVEGGVVHNVATPAMGAAAQMIAGFLSQTQANVAYNVKEPVTFGVIGVKYVVPMTGSKLRPYVMGGGGIAKVEQNATFTVGGTDITSSLASPQYGVQLGTDLSGTFTKPMFVVGGGVMWPVWQHLVVDVQYRYGRILAEDGAIDVSRAGLGIGVRF